MIELTYGPDVDWHKNVIAAGHCTLIWRGREHVIGRIEKVETETGLAAFSATQRLILRLFGRKHFEKMKLQ